MMEHLHQLDKRETSLYRLFSAFPEVGLLKLLENSEVGM